MPAHGFLPKISSNTKLHLRNIGRKFGFEIRLSGVDSRSDLRFVDFLKTHQIDTVLDVGANNGDFARTLFEAGFQGRIISFEPLPVAHEGLVQAAQASGWQWTIAPRMALAESDGTAQFNITAADSSSSLLEPSEEFVSDTSHVEIVETIEVPTKRLDGLAESLDISPGNTLLKLDVQGGEARVLEGSSLLLSKLAGLLSEMSLTPLYVGQPDFFHLHDLIAESGLELWDIWPVYRSSKNNRLLQFDGLYFRSSED